MGTIKCYKLAEPFHADYQAIIEAARRAVMEQY